MPEPKIQEKTWSKDFEKPLAKKWAENHEYRFNPKSEKKVYSIDTPPPYVNTPVHIGQAATYVLMDMFARFRRMTNYEVIFPFGLDRNGLPIEISAEKQFKTKFNLVSREEFVEMCSKVLEQSSNATHDTFMRLGISFNSYTKSDEIGSMYETDSPEYRALTQETFIDLWHKGLIYEDARINNFCPGCQTTIADAEIDYEDVLSFFNDVIFTVKETGEKIIIGTTRPELICTCGMVIFNPDDARYKHLDGKIALTPLYSKEIPIKAHPQAQIDKGTGLAMMCSAGDLSDIRFFREMNLKPTIAISSEGKMNEHSGFLNGLKIKDAREKIVEELQKNNLLVKRTQTTHRTPICERSKHHIEFISMKEFYLKQVEFKDKMKEFAYEMNFYAPESRQILLNWIDSVSIDWPISRRRYYATEVPMWYCKRCNAKIIPPKGKYYQPWRENPPIQKCGCGSTEFTGETRVFDTWFDSSITPLYILRYSRDKNFFEKNQQCSLRPQGKEIIRTWLYYTVLKDYLLTGKCIFKDVWINYHIVDDKGYKMSKSKGNVIEPREVLDKFGAEPFRLWTAVEGNLEKTDFRCSFDRIDGAGKTLTKLWNVARFISVFEYNEKAEYELTELDKWIISEINELVNFSRESYEKYDFHNPAIRIKHFIWEIFASHYLEMVKNRAYNQNRRFSTKEQNAGIFALNYCLDMTLKILSPVVPFITSEIYLQLRGKNIHAEEFPEGKDSYKVGFNSDDISALNGAIWKAKKDANLSLKAPVKELTMQEKFKTIEKDLKEMHTVEKIVYSEEIEVRV